MQNMPQKIHEISATIFDQIENGMQEQAFNFPGLYNGKFGILLFLSSYLDHFGVSRSQQRLYDIFLDKCLHEVSEGIQIHTYCSGLPGIIVCLRLMNKYSLIDLDYSEVEGSYRNYLLAKMISDIENQNYDFMHGGLGISLCYNTDTEFARYTLDALKKTAIHDDDKLKWKSSLGQNQGVGVNIALSHGMSSIVIYLSQLYKLNIYKDEVLSLLHGAINYIQAQQIDRDKYGSCFVAQSLENGSEIFRSRLGWCYGDLGVGAALWQAGRVTGNVAWQEQASNIYEFSSYRKTHINAMVNDAGLCHGSVGIAMMFDYMFQETENKCYKGARDYWLSDTIQWAIFSDGLAGYKIYHHRPDGAPEFVNNFNLLEGVAGIGLGLLSILNCKIKPILHEIFLLY